MSNGQSFREKQLAYPRVREAKTETQENLKAGFQSKGLSFPPKRIFIRAFKKEKELELWAQSDNQWHLFKVYDICDISGGLGPKRKEGDRQIPEGFYHISSFNPSSNFFLSLKLNYPNASDRVFADKAHPGSNIFIHGDCVTIGCIPLTDKWIKEVYWLAVLAKNNGQEKIPVHVFPFRMNKDKSIGAFVGNIESPGLIAFWKNLQQGYLYFETKRKLPRISVNSEGLYVFEK
jgi:murein L,D-transpeptidase YafK